MGQRRQKKAETTSERRQEEKEALSYKFGLLVWRTVTEL